MKPTTARPGNSLTAKRIVVLDALHHLAALATGRRPPVLFCNGSVIVVGTALEFEKLQSRTPHSWPRQLYSQFVARKAFSWRLPLSPVFFLRIPSVFSFFFVFPSRWIPPGTTELNQCFCFCFCICFCIYYYYYYYCCYCFFAARTPVTSTYGTTCTVDSPRHIPSARLSNTYLILPHSHFCSTTLRFYRPHRIVATYRRPAYLPATP